ncbi:MAG TPA: DUF115 domain-containing protein [Phycisphaerae bacterium]|nr:DUF115 domain-containing protein [Phycisphaerae bacterium]
MDAKQPPTTTAALDPAIYLGNMRYIWRHDAALALRIDAVPDAARMPAEATRSGAWTAAPAGPDGRPVHLHSRYDPAAETEKLIDAVDIEGQYAFFVSGFGLGYHLLALRRRISSEAIIVVAEPDVSLIATALACVDITEVLADGRLIIITQDSKAELHQRLQHHTALIMLGARFVTHPPSQKRAAEFHARLRGLFTEFAAYARTSLVTLVNNAQITCRNIANNLAAYASTTSIGPLERRFAGCPAIIVSAGPSLRHNVGELAAARDRAVICAVQTTLKTLVDRGISPHFVTSLDYHEVSSQYFDGVPGLENVHLVAEPKATWHVLDNYPGPISILDNSFARLLIGDELAPRAPLPAGATVAHLAFYLARYLGCDPIIFIGQDLAYTGYVYYSPGMEIHRSWRSEINRFNSMETKEWERTARMGPLLRRTVDAAGRKIYTDDLLFTYLEQFERDIAQTGARVINATEGGARIRGAEHMPLATALERYCAEPIPAERFDYLRTTRWRSPDVLPKVRTELAARIGEVDGVLDICTEMNDLLHELEGLLDKPQKFNQRLVRVDELRAAVNHAYRAYRIINTASQLSELRRFSADRKLSAAKAEGVDRAKQQLKRDIDFVGGLSSAGADVKKMLVGALERLDAAIAAGASA